MSAKSYFQCKNVTPSLPITVCRGAVLCRSPLPSPILTPYFLVWGDGTCLTFHYTLAEPTQLDSQPTMKFKLVTPNLFYKFQQQLIWPEFQCYLHA